MDTILQAWRDDGGYVGLTTLLDVIGPNDWAWHLEEFHSMTVAGAEVDALELESRLKGGESVSFTWEGLLAFAEQVHQLIDGRLSAYVLGEAEPMMLLEAVDSSHWKVTARDRDASAAAALDRVAALGH